jgi:hypothetical protein
MGIFQAFNFLRRPVPNSGPDNALAYAYQRTQAAPEVLFVANGRLVQRSFAPYEGAFIGIGFNPVQSAINATSLGVNSSLSTTPLTPNPATVSPGSSTTQI